MPKLSKASDRKTGKKASHKKSLESAEDWLAEAITLEDSGDRWVQDPPKAHRFYIQAQAAYERCLGLDSSVFDAAFNVARLYLQIAQTCALLAVPRLDTVRQGINAHRTLITRFPSNNDVKYNLAMMLQYYVELVTEHEVLSSQESEADQEVALRDAIELLRVCAVSQNSELVRLHAEESEVPETEQAAPESSEGEEMDVDVTYISYDVLFDTLLAIIEVYTQLLNLETISIINLLEEARTFVAEDVQPQLNTILPSCQNTNATQAYEEAMHAMKIAELESAYRQGAISLDDYRNSLSQMQLHGVNTAICCINADACIALSGITCVAIPDQDVTWKILTAGANDQITKAVNFMSQLKQKCPALHMTKGDIELLRASIDTDTARRNRPVLLKNAIIHYRRAMTDCLPKDIRWQNEAALKCAIVEGETSSATPAVPQMTTEEASQIISDARADGLFPGSWRLLGSNT